MPSCPDLRTSARWRNRARTALAAFLALIAPLAACAPRPRPFRPNILLVVIDCLRADHVGAYGYPRNTTPNLDRLAAEGIRFETAYANGTWTKPSMATLFTGRYPSQHGLLRIGQPAGDAFETDTLTSDIPTLAERLAAAGYRTYAEVNQPHLKAEFGFARGFTDYDWQLRNRSAGALGHDLLQALSAAKSDAPFFAWVHALDAHWPYRRPKAGRSDLGPAAVAPEPPRDQSHAVMDAWVRDHLTEANRIGLEGRYDREVALVDGALGGLVEALRERGELDRTLVIVTADHGEGFFEHGYLTHGFEPYEEVARVPLVFRPPAGSNLPAGTRRELVSHVDFAATLLDLLGLEPLAGSNGSSYAAVLRGAEPAAERPVLIQAELSTALRRGRYKLIQRFRAAPELFDLASDPGETRNLAVTACEGICDAMRAELRERLRALGPPHVPARGAFDAADAEALRALGYL